MFLGERKRIRKERQRQKGGEEEEEEEDERRKKNPYFTLPYLDIPQPRGSDTINNFFCFLFFFKCKDVPQGW